MKRCSHCHEVKPVQEFRPLKSKPNNWYAQCRPCEALSLTENRRQHPERTRAKSRELQKKRRDKLPELFFEIDLKRWLKPLGLTLADYYRILDKQGGVCAICRQPQRHRRMKRLVLDHDHFTGVFRGLLCSHCNQALGLMADDPSLLRRAATYLDLTDAQQGRFRVVE
jgi:hypothetical protein